MRRGLWTLVEFQPGRLLCSPSDQPETNRAKNNVSLFESEYFASSFLVVLALWLMTRFFAVGCFWCLLWLMSHTAVCCGLEIRPWNPCGGDDRYKRVTIEREIMCQRPHLFVLKLFIIDVFDDDEGCVLSVCSAFCVARGCCG